MGYGLKDKTEQNQLITKLHNAGLSGKEIEPLLGLDHSTICRRLKHLTPRKTTEIFKSQRADIFAELGRKLLQTCDIKAIKSMSVRDRILAMGIVYDKERVERGQNDSKVKPMIQIVIGGAGSAQPQVVISARVERPAGDFTTSPLLGEAEDVDN